MAVDINATLSLVAEIDFKSILTNKYFLQYLQSVTNIDNIDNKTLTNIQNIDNDDFFQSILTNDYLNNICLIIQYYTRSLEFKDVNLQLSHFNSRDFTDNIFPDQCCTKKITKSSDLTFRFIKEIKSVWGRYYEGAREEEYINIDLVTKGKDHLQDLCYEMDIVTKCDIYMCLSTQVIK